MSEKETIVIKNGFELGYDFAAGVAGLVFVAALFISGVDWAIDELKHKFGSYQAYSILHDGKFYEAKDYRVGWSGRVSFDDCTDADVHMSLVGSVTVTKLRGEDNPVVQDCYPELKKKESATPAETPVHPHTMSEPGVIECIKRLTPANPNDPDHVANACMGDPSLGLNR
jgi:hypothetical protein